MQTNTWLSVLFALFALLVGCGPQERLPEGHVVLSIDTDAPLPVAVDAVVDSNHPAPLFDRLRIELVRNAEAVSCPSCTNEFAVDEESFRAAATLTVMRGTFSGPVTARIRLFRSRSIAGDTPASLSTIETWVVLPDIPAEGRVHASVFLATDNVGIPIGSAAHPVPATIAGASSRVGTWRGAKRTPCVGEPRAGEVCVPGGAFWMGDLAAITGDDLTGEFERLVVLAPFYMTDHEVTVAEYRAAAMQDSSQVVAWSGNHAGTVDADFCRYTAEAGPFESFPMNCLKWTTARNYCTSIGGDLPTEAQFEYVAGALESRPFPWGRDHPSCDDAVWGRAGSGPYIQMDRTCLEKWKEIDPNIHGGPVPLPKNRDDEVTLARHSRLRAAAQLPTGLIWDIAGNLQEYTRDAFALSSDPCWRRADTNVFLNPYCETPAPQYSVPSVAHTVRGGGWLNAATIMQSAIRYWRTEGIKDSYLGFRCVRRAGD